MSCDKCEEAQEQGLVAYYRWGTANIGLIGCDIHLIEIIKVLNDYQFKEKKQ